MYAAKVISTRCAIVQSSKRLSVLKGIFVVLCCASEKSPPKGKEAQLEPPLMEYIAKVAAAIRAAYAYAGTTTVQEAFKGWEMPKKRPSLGVAMVGDQQFVLIPASASVPCTAKQVALNVSFLSAATMPTITKSLMSPVQLLSALLE